MKLLSRFLLVKHPIHPNLSGCFSRDHSVAEEIISQVYPLQFSIADNRETSKSPSSTSPGPVRSEAGTLVDSEAEDPIEFGVVNLLARVKTA